MDQYGYYKNKKQKQSGGTLWPLIMRFVDFFVKVITCICSILLIFSYISRYINPEGATFFVFAGLLFPVFYIAETILALYWIMRWRRIALFVCGILIFGIGYAKLFYQPDFTKRYDNGVPLRTEQVIMSYNVMLFNYPNPDKGKKQVERIAEFIKSNNVDIVCFQEFNNTKDAKNTLSTTLPNLQYTYFKSYTGDSNQGLAIYSKHPIIRSGVVNDTLPGTLRSIWSDIRIKRDTIRVVNNHLQNTYVSGSDLDYLSSLRSVSEDSRRTKNKIKGIARKMREGYIKRALQADAIAEFIKDSPYPLIVCGDFNDTPVSYAYNTISGDLNDSFVEKGYGTAGTYNGFFNMFRIDYILMSDEINIINYYPFDVVYSDHNPIATSFDIVGEY